MTGMLLGVPLWLLGIGAASLLLLMARPLFSTDPLTWPTAVLVAVTLSGVSAASASAPVGLASVALLLGLVATAVGFRRGDVRLVRSPLWLAAAAVFATWTLSLTQAADVGAGAALLFERGRDMVVLLVVLLLLVAVPRLRPVVAAAVLLVAALAGLTIAQEFILGNSTNLGGLAKVPIAEDIGGVTGRHAGPLTDVNFWGRLLILTLPLALALGTGKERGARLWLLVAAVVAGGIYLTGSRGALIALLVTIGVWLFLTKPGPRTLFALGAGATVVLAVPGVLTRLLATLAAVGGTTDLAIVDPSLSNRTAIWVVGLAMAEDHPVLGVGLGNFLQRQPEYQRATGESISEGLLAPHNLYVELLAETGVAGLAAWLFLIGTTAFVTTRALIVARRLSPGPEADLGVRLSAAVLAALAGWSVASVPLHLADLSALLVVVALGAALDVRTNLALEARKALGEPPGVPPSSVRPPRTPQLFVVGFAALALLAGVEALARGSAAPHWSATAVATVVPTEPGAADQAYAYDVQSRDRLLPTYAALLRNLGFARTAAQDAGIDTTSLSGVEVSAAALFPASVVNVTVTSTDPDVAQRLAPAIVLEVGDWLDITDPLYRLELSGDVEVLPDSSPAEATLPFVAFAVICGACALIGLRRGVRQRSLVAQP